MREGVELRRFTGLAACILAVVTASPVLAAPQPSTAKPAEAAAPKPSLQSHRLSQPPVIDAVLDDEPGTRRRRNGRVAVLQSAAREKIPQKTRRGSDTMPNYLYFAFQCDDPDPSAIKTSITRRDNIWSDDWVGHQPRRAGDRSAVLSHDGQSQRRAARHAQQRVGRRRPIAGLRLGQRRPQERQGLRGRDARAAADDSLQGRPGRAHGHPVLAPRQPRRRVGRVATARTWQVGVREARAAGFGELRPRLIREIIPSTTYARARAAGRAVALGARGQSRGLRHQRQVRHHVDRHARRDGQSRLQPGRERRVPGRGEPAIPELLLREASILHGGRRDLHARRAGERQQPPGRGPHPQDRRSRVRREGHGSLGRWAFGALSALDQSPGRNLPEGHLDTGKDRLFNIAVRSTASDPSDYVGGIAIDTEFAGGYNRVAGADLSWRVNSTQRLSGFALGSTTRDPACDGVARRHRRAGRATNTTRAARVIGYARALRLRISRWTPRSSTASASRAGGATRNTVSIRRRRSRGCCASRRSRSLRAARTGTPAAANCCRSPACGSGSAGREIRARRSLRRLRALGRSAVRPRAPPLHAATSSSIAG